MKCPHLNKWILHSCRATENVYFPSAFQIEEYCKRKSHRKCPFFAAHTSLNEFDKAIQLSPTANLTSL